jgi:hypothetical protein
MTASRKENKWWRDGENILILNAGAVRLAVPRSWSVEGMAEGLGYLNVKDPSDSCALQISCLSIPPLLPTAPPIDQMLREAVPKDHPSAAFAPVVTSRREQMEIAWLDYGRGNFLWSGLGVSEAGGAGVPPAAARRAAAGQARCLRSQRCPPGRQDPRKVVAPLDYSYGEQDTERDEWRVAHARVLFASNRVFGALLSFYYWEDDAAWAVPAWERMVETLYLGDRGLLRPDPESRRN